MQFKPIDGIGPAGAQLDAHLDQMGLALYALPMSGLALPMALPIDPPLFAAFMLAASAVVVSPGPDTIVFLRHAINIVWQGLSVAAAGHMRRWLQSASVQRAVSRAAGAILIAFAVAMVWSNLAA